MLSRLHKSGNAVVFQAQIVRHGLSKASRIFSHTTMRERKQLFDLARTCPPNATALEVGSHLGSSACFMAAGLKKAGGRLYCVDTWNNETMPDGARDTFDEFQRNTSPYSSSIITVRKRSQDLTEEDVNCPLDLVFLDGDHSEEMTLTDFLKTGSWVKPNGIIAFHDCVYFEGVTKVIGRALLTGEWEPAGHIDNLMWLKKR